MSLSPQPQLPKSLAKQYEAQERLSYHLGKETWLATDRLSGKTVVIKLLFFDANFDWQNHKLFEREAKVLQGLTHPQIPKFINWIDFKDHDRTGFALIQSHITGMSLATHLQNGRVFSDNELQELARKLLEILIFLHSRNPPVIHRDIKPSNIILGDRTGNSFGDVFLVDFGAVQTVLTPGSTKTVVGTYGYMPPEQFGDRTVPASDLYSLGASLIHLATGQYPGDLPQANLKIQFESLVQMEPNFIRWINQLIEPSLDQRFASSEAALEALDNPQRLVLQPKALTKPQYSRIRLQKTQDQLNLTIPAPGFQPQLIALIPFAIAWNSFILFWSTMALSIPFPINLVFLLFSLPFWTVGIGMILSILFSFAGQFHCQITPTEFQQTLQLFGIRIRWPRPSATQDIESVEFIDAHWKRNSHGERTSVPPRLLVTTGSAVYKIGAFMPLKKRELQWLAQELSQWLGLPITTEPTSDTPPLTSKQCSHAADRLQRRDRIV